MDNRTIYIKPDEEITSVIDKLIKIKAEAVFLIIPKGAVLTQSLVNLKLLKREADNLHKEITIVSPDSTIQRLAKKVHFLTSESLADLDEEAAKEEETAPVLEERISPRQFEDFLKEERRASPLRMSDIVKLEDLPKEKTVKKKIKEISQKATNFFLNKKSVAKEAQDQEKEGEIKIKTVVGEQVEAEEERAVFHDKKISDFLVRRAKEKDFAEDKVEQRVVFSAAGKKRIVSADNVFIPSFSLKIFGIFIVSAAIISGLVFYLVLPKAEVKISAKREKIDINLAVLADKNSVGIDASQSKIPAQIIKLEERQSSEFPASGERQLNEKAEGTITVFNAYSSSPQALVETTRFLSSDNKIFRLTKTITVPGAKIEEGQIVPSQIDVLVEADLPGADFNIGPSDFTIPGFKGSPKYSGFYGKSRKAMEGGSTDKIKVLTQDDFNKAKETVWAGLGVKIKEELINQIPEGFKALEETIQIQIAEAKSSVEVGGKAESFSLEIRGAAKALIFREEDISELVKKNLFGELQDKKDFVGQPTFDYSDIKAEIEKGRVSFKVEGQQEVVWRVDQEEIKKMIAGKQEADVRKILSERPEIKEAEFSLWPFWIKKIPNQSNKIQITID